MELNDINIDLEKTFGSPVITYNQQRQLNPLYSGRAFVVAMIMGLIYLMTILLHNPLYQWTLLILFDH